MTDLKKRKANLTTLLGWHLSNGVDTALNDTPTSKLTQLQPPLTTSTTKYTTVSKETHPETISRTYSDKANNLKELESYVKTFEGCAIKISALNTVFGDGSPDADIMFIGEAPGASEDKEGIPFCGQSGKLLNNILKSIGLERQKVYITNTVFWRPPANRRPTPQELETCRPFVEKHIALINPKLIVLVGSTAVESLLGSKVPMHEIRDGHYEYKNKYLTQPIRTIVIFHPSYLLRQQSKKKLMWFDILRIKKLLAEI